MEMKTSGIALTTNAKMQIGTYKL